MTKHTLLTGTAFAVLVGLAAPVAAQGLEEIVVTARKREEKLSEIPLSITAFSAEDIARKGFRDLEDITKAAPGVQYSNMGNQIPGRYDSQIRFRGMNVNISDPSLQLGSLFVDGVYVLGGSQSIPVNDLERIEVIKGPQSAYFGRGTFGGAINYITRNPSLTDYKGQVDVSAATYSDFDVSAAHEGPIVTDKLGYRVAGRFYSKGAMFRATDGGGLGEESSKSVSGVLYGTPTDNFKFKVRVFYDKDDDGPAAGGLVEGLVNDSCSGKSIATQDPNFPTINPRNYICGAVPGQGKAISALGNTKIIDSNTSLANSRGGAQGVPNFLIQTMVTNAPPGIFDVPQITHMGLVRDVIRVSGNMDYEFAGGYIASLQGGYNRLRANWIRDFGLTAIDNWYSRDPEDSTDYSGEFRIASPQNERLSGQLGVNYYNQKFIQSGSGGDAVTFCTPNANVAGLPLYLTGPNDCRRTAPALFANGGTGNTNTIKAFGVFGAIAYNITDQIIANFEGRYQYNKSTALTGTLAPGISKIDKVFLPRAILKYQPSSQTNVYGSYSRGFIQGQPNAFIGNATPNELKQYQASLPQATPTLPAETLDMFELGWKQQLWENRANFNLAGYYGKWKNQKGRGVVFVQEDCGSIDHGGAAGATAASGCPNGVTGLPARNADGTPFLNSRNVQTAGSSNIWGIEFEGNVRLAEGWDNHLNIAWAKSKYTDYIFNFMSVAGGLPGVVPNTKPDGKGGTLYFQQTKGNSNARFPVWSGAYSTTYTRALNDTWEWFVGGDVIYVGKSYADEVNLAWCAPYWTVNTKAGLEKKDLRVELFVKNLLNDDSWTGCARWSDFDRGPNPGGGTINQGIAVTPQNKRQFGMRASVKF
jgi:iron complex outermembrane receptor protein